MKEAEIRTRCLSIIRALKTATKTQIKDGAGITDKKFEDYFANGGGLFVHEGIVRIKDGFGIHGESGYSLTEPDGHELLDYYDWSIEWNKRKYFFRK